MERRQPQCSAASFVALITSIGKFRFRLKAGNGEIIAAGEACESKASAKNGVESVLKNAAARRLST
jgi:uncharacterized protein YegP (UPF0339 family)